MTSDHGVDGQPECNWRYVGPTSESEKGNSEKRFDCLQYHQLLDKQAACLHRVWLVICNTGWTRLRFSRGLSFLSGTRLVVHTCSSTNSRFSLRSIYLRLPPILQLMT